MNIEIYTEYTPNPESLKFVLNRMLLPGNSVDAHNDSTAEGVPLAAALMKEFEVINRVFIASNFITLTKNNPQIAWIELVPTIKEFLKKYISDNKPIVTHIKHAIPTEIKEGSVAAKVRNILETHVRPAVEMDGGYISFKSYKDGVVTVVMHGSCSGCPSSTLTLKAGIEGLLKRLVPEVTEVIAESE